jgi:CheY-like chemotaxis protein
VLVVDDQRDVRQMLTAVLRSAGYAVESAADADEALERVATFDPEVVVCDLTLGPPMDGPALARAMRSGRLRAGAALIALTGRRDPEDEAAARDAGFQHYLMKPLDLGTLLRTLDQLD